ncbi:MAG: ketoacyl-ACP synthase III [Cyclobacteriaceae bacterium]|nr:ketoacyl-ACP synthase III [Cyclobacteriaceae bacterium]
MGEPMIRSIITGTGSYIPEIKVANATFADHLFLDKEGAPIKHDNSLIIKKFQDITGIAERRYARPGQLASDLGVLAGEQALSASAIDRETLDYIIVAHNFGNLAHGSNRSNLLPSMASRIKAGLRIENPDCVGYDLPFGCPGWLQGVIQAHLFMKAGEAKRCLVIGTETLSRLVDPHDRDSMIYSDGSGAVVLEAKEGEQGVIGHKTQTFALHHSELLNMGPSYSGEGQGLFIKMNGRKVYEFALNHVPLVVKSVLDKAGVHIREIKKVLIHQANEKMDNAILERLFKLYGIDTVPEGIMPMTIGWLGNSSVATVPTLLDLVLKVKMEGHHIQAGDNIVMASVGAGMNINALLYRF